MKDHVFSGSDWLRFRLSRRLLEAFVVLCVRYPSIRGEREVAKGVNVVPVSRSFANGYLGLREIDW